MSVSKRMGIYLVFGIMVGICGLLALLGGSLRAEEAAPPVPGGTIVFASDCGGAWDIWSMKANGSELQQLTKDAYADSDPKFSPDGARIIYSSLRKGIVGLWMINRDGTSAKRICEGCQADWSPDGKRILFIRDNQVYLRELVTGNERIVTPSTWERCGFPSWHPDGKHFAVASRHVNPIGVWILDLEGKTPPVQLKTNKEACTPRWSKGGKQLLYQSSSHVYRIGADSKDDEQLTFGGDIQHFAVYSPGESMILFCRGTSPTGPWQLYRMNLDDESVVQLTTDHSNMYPDWTLK